jgi:hypothetical protein
LEEHDLTELPPIENTELKDRAWATLAHMASATHGNLYDPNAALEELKRFGGMRMKQTASRSYQKIVIGLGDPSCPDTFCEWPVAVFTKTQKASIPKLEMLSLLAVQLEKQSEDHLGRAQGSLRESIGKCVMDRGFRAVGPSGEPDPNDIEVYSPESLISAYRYGGVYIPVGDWEKSLELKLETKKECAILAFVPESTVSHSKLNLCSMSNYILTVHFCSPI